MVLKHMADFIGRLPATTLDRWGRRLGHIAYLLDIRHRRIIQHNLSFIYPNRNPRQIRHLTKKVFQHFSIVLLEILQAPFLSKDRLIERVPVEGLESLSKAMDHPWGCIVYSSHIGNWELGFLALSARLNRSILTVAKPIKLQIAHRWLTYLRTRFGNRMVFKEGALPFMTRSLKNGDTIAVLIDQGVRRTEAVEVTFLGKRTMATPAASLLGLRCRAPILPVFCIRQSDGRYKLMIRPAVHIERSGSLRRDIICGTQALMAVLEEPIRQYPEQWFWFHKRWKRTYPEVYPEYQIIRRRKRRKKGLEC